MVIDMEIIEKMLQKGSSNFVFVGEAGSGKSEVAINFAKYLVDFGDKAVHFFDLDMTKPLFRSREVKEEIEGLGIEFHHEEQFMDAPTLVGGVKRLLRDKDCYVVLDVGGDYMGARAIGGFAPELNKQESTVYYVINPFRPWSLDVDHIDQVLGGILHVSHLEIEKLRLITNPNMGYATDRAQVVEGQRKIESWIAQYKPVDFMCVHEGLWDEVREAVSVPLLPLHLYLTYPWEQGDEIA